MSRPSATRHGRIQGATEYAGETKENRLHSSRRQLFKSTLQGDLGHEKFHHIIRQTLIQYTRENGHLFQKFVFNGTLEAHCKKMECTSYWGSQVEINAAAT